MFCKFLEEADRQHADDSLVVLRIIVFEQCYERLGHVDILIFSNYYNLQSFYFELIRLHIYLTD